MIETHETPIARLSRANFNWNMAKGKRRNVKPGTRERMWAELIAAARAVGELDPDSPPALRGSE